MYKGKRTLLLIFFGAFVFLCITSIEAVIKDVKASLSLCINAIVPSLFIFCVIANLALGLLMQEKIKFTPRFVAFLFGTLFGFPIGALSCKRLCEANVLSKSDAAKIIPFCNNASYAFVVGSIGIYMLKSAALGLVLFLSEAIASAIPLIFIKTEVKQCTQGALRKSFAALFFESIESSIFTVLRICALICFFSAVLSVFPNLAFISIFLEIGNGISYAIGFLENSLLTSLLLCSFCCGFSGICVQLQIKLAFGFSELKFTNLIFSKLFVGILSVLLSLLGYYLLFMLELF